MLATEGPLPGFCTILSMLFCYVCRQSDVIVNGCAGAYTGATLMSITPSVFPEEVSDFRCLLIYCQLVQNPFPRNMHVVLQWSTVIVPPPPYSKNILYNPDIYTHSCTRSTLYSARARLKLTILLLCHYYGGLYNQWTVIINFTRCTCAIGLLYPVWSSRSPISSTALNLLSPSASLI